MVSDSSVTFKDAGCLLCPHPTSSSPTSKHLGQPFQFFCSTRRLGGKITFASCVFSLPSKLGWVQLPRTILGQRCIVELLSRLLDGTLAIKPTSGYNLERKVVQW